MRKTVRKKAASRARPGRPDGSDQLGPRLRDAREKKGVTLRGLARKVGVSASLVSQIEHGHVMPSVGTLYAISNELGLLVDDLFRGAAIEKFLHFLEKSRRVRVGEVFAAVHDGLIGGRFDGAIEL